MAKKRIKQRLLLIVSTLVILVGGGFYIQKVEGVSRDNRVGLESLSDRMVIPGGMAVGIYMETDGVMVIGTEGIKNTEGRISNPAQYIVKEGDYITAINDREVKEKSDLIDAIREMQSGEVVLTLRRDGEKLQVKFQSIEVAEGVYKLGIWVRDNVQGLGTLTYLSTTSKFGALGHGIHDVDTGELLEITGGELYTTSIRGVEKGRAGSPGGLEGVIVYNTFNEIGKIEKNTENGVYGELENIDDIFDHQEAVEICAKEDVKEGPAVIRCCVDNSVKEYDIRILKVDLYSRTENKSIVLQVTDEELLEKTGGIVQGMSGSPILQDGKMVGAVTHVFVNDPTSGYGIFIEDMLDAANTVAEEHQMKDAS